jgi:hypothetical protein
MDCCFNILGIQNFVASKRGLISGIRLVRIPHPPPTLSLNSATCLTTTTDNALYWFSGHEHHSILDMGVPALGVAIF